MLHGVNKYRLQRGIEINIDYLKPLYPEYNYGDIYFSELNTKYISLNVLKILVISRVRSTSEIADIFNTLDEILLVFTENS